ncbi:MAG: peptide-methionine (R)-S-oxide reductase [Nitrospira sp.]|nr:peptide-methionine (R)-S-oxide reductase [Nitrospira sp.]
MPQKVQIDPIIKITKTDDEWKKQLSAPAYRVLRHEDTERPFVSPLHDNHESGIYHCAGCDLPLFSSEHKFDSGTGWPSFGNRSIHESSRLERTSDSSSPARKFIAPAVKATRAMCLRMGQSRPGYATALTE